VTLFVVYYLSADLTVAAMESEPTVSGHVEETEQTTAANVQLTETENPKLSDTSYAVVIKYDDCYAKSCDGILRVLHAVSSFYLFFDVEASVFCMFNDFSFGYCRTCNMTVFT